MLRLAQSALTRSSRSYSSQSGPERKVAILGAAGGIGQILSMRMKLNPLIFRLALYAIAGTPGVSADFSHINTRSEIKSGSKDSEDHLSTTSAFSVLRVKVFHRDVRKNAGNSDLMIRRVIQAYEMLSNLIRSEIIERIDKKVVVGAAVICMVAVICTVAVCATVALVIRQRINSSSPWARVTEILKELEEKSATPLLKLRQVTDSMIVEMHAGLASKGGFKLKMLLSYVDNLPTGLTEVSQEHQEDGLERAVALFGCVLENFKNKLLSSTKKRSSEILESTEHEIHSKFQSAKTQIEKDVARLTRGSRSKRQIIEKRFNEQQEQLQFIHDKFNSEIQRHLEDFTRTFESLEAHGKELEGVIERRKALHHKLLVQVEEAVKNHLIDAQRSLISIQTAGRSKMQHLKTAIAKCLEGDIFV